MSLPRRGQSTLGVPAMALWTRFELHASRQVEVCELIWADGKVGSCWRSLVPSFVIALSSTM